MPANNLNQQMTVVLGPEKITHIYWNLYAYGQAD
jgi:hypothetical protein